MPGEPIQYYCITNSGILPILILQRVFPKGATKLSREMRHFTTDANEKYTYPQDFLVDVQLVLVRENTFEMHFFNFKVFYLSSNSQKLPN